MQNKGERREALKTIASYLQCQGRAFTSQITGGKTHVKARPLHTGINDVILVGHDSICGAVKYFLGGKSLPELLNVNSRSLHEQVKMKQLISAGAEPWLKAFGLDKVFCKLAIIDESHQTVQLKDFISVKPLFIENLINFAA